MSTTKTELSELIEKLPRGPELVSGLAGIGASEALRGRAGAGLVYAERAVALADELGLDGAKPLGRRGLVRCALGDGGGLDDLREGIRLATQAGDGAEAATSYINLGSSIFLFEGPAVALEVTRQAIAFVQARGLALKLNWLTLGELEYLVESGEIDKALEGALGFVERLRGGDDAVGLSIARTLLARLLALQGRPEQMADSLGSLETSARALEEPQWIVLGLGASALIRAALGENNAAAALLDEIDAYPGAREDQAYCSLPMLVRTALKIGQVDLAERLTTGFEPCWPYADLALIAATAAVAEAHGHHQTAAAGYVDAAQRWGSFGSLTEQAFALLGHGRCLLALNDPTATQPLHHARDLFTRLQAAPYIAECDTLLAQAAERAS